MREIKFRGKNQYGKWMTGSLVTHNGDCKIIPSPIGQPRTVDPATVGQFTGLTDMTGKEIYEGDLIEVEGLAFLILEIAWNKEYATFTLDEHTVYQGDIPGITPIGRIIKEFPNWEVVGNIHDNPIQTNKD